MNVSKSYFEPIKCHHIIFAAETRNVCAILFESTGPQKVKVPEEKHVNTAPLRTREKREVVKQERINATGVDAATCHVNVMEEHEREKGLQHVLC